VPVERPQARRLAADRRRRARRPARAIGSAVPVAGRKVGEEVGDVGAVDLGRAALAAREEGAELEQVGPVGVERVAREAALELEVGEEIEYQRLEARVGELLGGLLDRDRDIGRFSRPTGAPARATPPARRTRR
jgi:hypothetical protein